MSERNKHKKASDVFRESNPVLGRKVPTTEAFPEIESVNIEVEESGHGILNYTRKSSYRDLKYLGEYIDCSNPCCYNGGFSIGSILRSMVFDKKTDFETSAICQGYEGSPQGRRRYRSCTNFFRIKIVLKYKEN